MVSPPHPSQPGVIREPGAELPRTFFLGRYRVVDEIGIGGMASVHLARVDGPGGFQKWVAIKRIHPHLVEDDQFVDMFLDEARIAAGINHANVAQVFDLGKDESTYWIAMEYLHGEPLREVMRRVEERGDRVPYHIAARICADASEGLHGAHELRGRNGQLLNLVHRDVTPHNLFITYEGYTKVVDFGIAKVVDRLASTRAGTLKGKLAYMSPEQVRGQEVDRRTDIFALGVVLWELTTNRRLFRMETDLDTLEKVQACVVPLPTTLMPNYPPELEQVVMRALAQRREDRFQTARELSRALQRFLMTQGTFVGPEDVGDYVKGLFTDRVRKRERYLEWAAEVTSAVDVEELRKQQAGAEQQNPSLLHGDNGSMGAASSLHAGTPSQSHVRDPVPGAHRSYGQDSAAASVVASVPHQSELASSSLMDEDEDIPTVVAQPREPDPPQRGIRPAAGAPPPAPVWDGMRTQLMDPEDGNMGATIALPDQHAAGAIHARVHEMEQRLQQYPPQQQYPAQQPQYGQQPYAQQPPAYTPQPARTQQQPAVPPPMMHYPPPQQQGAVETKMSLPRPAAVAQWLLEQGDVEIQGPRSTGVVIAIAALATLCVMGVASLIVYKLRLPPPTAVVAPSPVTKPVANERDEEPETTSEPKTPASKTNDGDGRKTPEPPKPAAGGKSEPAPKRTEEPAGEPPGRLSVSSKPPCDSVIVAGSPAGACPLSGYALPPGTHRVTLKRGAISKTIVVQITSGQTTSQSVSMK